MAATLRDDDDEIISSINITPFVDVSLVILIIFLVTATYIVARSIPVDLPKARTGENVSSPLAIYLDAKGVIYLDGVAKTEPELLAELQRASAESSRLQAEARARGQDATGYELRAVIAADGAIAYRDVMHLTDLARRAGISKLAFNVRIEEEPAAAGAAGGP
jgi:biopolymer transport protein ExbD